MNSFSDLLIEPLNQEMEDVITFKKRLVKYSAYVFDFLINQDIPPDNNGSERAIINFKIKLKISDFFKIHSRCQSVCNHTL